MGRRNAILMTSIFDIFKIGIGPSSSHTVGPMVAAGRFLAWLDEQALTSDTARITCRLYGSLAHTGKGHRTDLAVVLGLAGETPTNIDPDKASRLFDTAATQKSVLLAGRHNVALDPASDIVFDRDTPSPGHPNALRLLAYSGPGKLIGEKLYYSVGGGSVLSEEEYAGGAAGSGLQKDSAPHAFSTAAELLKLCESEDKSIAELVLANEHASDTPQHIRAEIDRLHSAMMDCIDRGLLGEGVLPGRLGVRRRAKGLFEAAAPDPNLNFHYPHQFMDRVSAYAIAVNEENASGGRVVTAPTNGAAGVIPAVLRYFAESCSDASQIGVREFLLTATAFGAIIKSNASLSGAEVGCQGEVGSASAMAAAGLCAALGGTPEQTENAAEIALEHHLGMTCDPIGGLVQVPCIERNSMGALKAINAASLALAGDGQHIVSFDAVVETMRQTGLDLQTKYKETSQGGLAVTVVEC